MAEGKFKVNGFGFEITKFELGGANCNSSVWCRVPAGVPKSLIDWY